jgi:hypothetical protein
LGTIAHESSLDAPPQLEGRLLEAFRAHHQQLVPVAPKSSGSLAWLPVAAGVVLAVGGAWWYAAQPGRSSGIDARRAAQHGPAVEAAASASSIPAPAVSPAISDPQQQAAAAKQRAERTTVFESGTDALDPSASDSIDRDPEEVFADFVALPYGAMPTDDDVHVVQIDVPREALYDFGSAAQLTAAGNDLVTADVLIGDDGAPRAFRIVEPAATPVASTRSHSRFGTRSPRQ